MVNRLTRSINSVLTIISLRGQCILCGAKAQSAFDMCRACHRELPFIGPKCQRCSLPLKRLNEHHCGQCLNSPPSFQRTEAIWEYLPPIAQLISAFKYNNRLSYGETLLKIARPLIASAYSETPLPDIITPIPLHWSRRWQRGFNQSELLARSLSNDLNIPLQHCLNRQHRTDHQQTLNAQQRRRNLRNAFKITSSVEGQTVAVVDDVMTTGATAEEVSKCLLTARAKAVHIWCLARTP